jgi:hypothetical protein
MGRRAGEAAVMPPAAGALATRLRRDCLPCNNLAVIAYTRIHRQPPHAHACTPPPPPPPTHPPNVSLAEGVVVVGLGDGEVMGGESVGGGGVELQQHTLTHLQEERRGGWEVAGSAFGENGKGGNSVACGRSGGGGEGAWRAAAAGFPAAGEGPSEARRGAPDRQNGWPSTSLCPPPLCRHLPSQTHLAARSTSPDTRASAAPRP